MSLLSVLGLRRPKKGLAKAGPTGDPGAQPGGPGTAKAAAAPTNGKTAAAPADPAAAEAERAAAASFKRFEAFARRVDAALDRAKADIDAQPIAALKARLQAELVTLQQARREADVQEPAVAAKRVEQLDWPASNFALRAEGLRKEGSESQRDVNEHCVKPLAQLTAKVNALSGGWTEVFAPQLQSIQAGLAEVNARLDRGEFDALPRPIGTIFYACQNLDAAVEGYRTDYPPYAAQRVKVEAMLARMQAGGMLDAAGRKSVDDLTALMESADALGPIRGYKAALSQLNQVVVKAVSVRDTNAAYRIAFIRRRTDAGQARHCWSASDKPC